MRRLKQLEKNGYIRIVDKTYTGENVYGVTKKTCNTFNLLFESIPKTSKLNHSLAEADLYYYLLSTNNYVKEFSLEVQYYFNHNKRKYTFRPDIFLETDRKILVEIDLCNRRFEDKVKKWELFYIDNGYLKYFNKYPPILIVTTNINKVKRIIDDCKSIDLNYVYKDYKEVKNWKYKY